MARVCARCRDDYAPEGAFVCAACQDAEHARAARERAKRLAYYDANAEVLRAKRRLYGYFERRAAGIPTREESMAERDAPILALAERLGRIPMIREVADEVGTSYQAAAVRRRRIFQLNYRKGDPAARVLGQYNGEPGTCEFCGEPYLARRHFPPQRFCSYRCCDAARRERNRKRKRETHVQH